MNLSKLIKILAQENPKRFIDVYDKNTGSKLYPAIDLSFIKTRNADPKAWFKSLFQKHYTDELEIQLKRPNGTSKAAVGGRIFIKNKDSDSNSITNYQPTVAPAPPQQQPTVSPGLFGGGLNGEEMRRVFDYDRVETLLRDSQRKEKEWYDKYQKSEEEKRKLESKLYSYDDKKQLEIDRIKSDKAPLISDSTLEKFAPILGTLVEKFAGVGQGQNIPQDAGLSGNKNLSKLQQQFVGMITAPDMNDDIITLMYLVGKGIIETQTYQGFSQELQTLLYAHSLLESPPMQKVQ